MGRSKNAQRGSGPAQRKQVFIDREVRLVQVLGPGSHVRVLIPETGRSVHDAYRSERVRDAFQAVAACGFGDRLLAEADVVEANYPLIAEVMRAALAPQTDAELIAA